MSNKQAPKMINYPPRRTVKRKRALELFHQWSKEGRDVELVASGNGIRFTGKLRELELDNGRSFIFVNQYGVYATLFTDLYERVSVTEVPGIPVAVNFSRKEVLSEGFTLALPLEPSSNKKQRDGEQLNEVLSLFRQWERLHIQVHTQLAASALAIAIQACRVKEITPGRFLFLGTNDSGHIVVPTQSDAADMRKIGESTCITLSDNKSDIHFTAMDGLEATEDIISRFSTLTSLTQ